MPQTRSLPPETPDAPLLALPDPDQQAQWTLFRALVVTVQHFFGGFDHLCQFTCDNVPGGLTLRN